jgi:hypothetical protein
VAAAEELVLELQEGFMHGNRLCGRESGSNKREMSSWVEGDIEPEGQGVSFR